MGPPRAARIAGLLLAVAILARADEVPTYDLVVEFEKWPRPSLSKCDHVLTGVDVDQRGEVRVRLVDVLLLVESYYRLDNFNRTERGRVVRQARANVRAVAGWNRRITEDLRRAAADEKVGLATGVRRVLANSRLVTYLTHNKKKFTWAPDLARQGSDGCRDSNASSLAPTGDQLDLVCRGDVAGHLYRHMAKAPGSVSGLLSPEQLPQLAPFLRYDGSLERPTLSAAEYQVLFLDAFGEPPATGDALHDLPDTRTGWHSLLVLKVREDQLLMLGGTQAKSEEEWKVGIAPILRAFRSLRDRVESTHRGALQAALDAEFPRSPGCRSPGKSEKVRGEAGLSKAERAAKLAALHAYDPANRSRHSYESFLSRLEALSRLEEPRKAGIEALPFPDVWVIIILLDFEEVLTQACYPAVPLLAAIKHYTKSVELALATSMSLISAARQLRDLEKDMVRYQVLDAVMETKLRHSPSQHRWWCRRFGIAAQKVRNLYVELARYRSASVNAGKLLFSNELSAENTANYRRAGVTRAERQRAMQDALWEVQHVLTDVLQVEWSPKGGTFVGFLRYGSDAAQETEHPDLENDDLDLMLGADHEVHATEIMTELGERLRHLPSGPFECFAKSFMAGGNAEPGAEFRHDLIYCVRKEPVLQMLDIGSYIRDSERDQVYAHRLCQDNSHFTLRPYNCTIRPDLIFFNHTVTPEEMYPSQKCRAYNMTIPCPSPQKALAATLLDVANNPEALAATLVDIGHPPSDAECAFLPPWRRLKSWSSVEWERLLSYADWLDGLPEGVLSITPYIWKRQACRNVVEHFAPGYIRNRIAKQYG